MNRPFLQLQGLCVTLLIFVLCLSGTYFTWHWVQEAAAEKSARMLNEKTDALITAVESRSQIYINLLQGLRSLFSASDHVSAAEFQTYLDKFTSAHFELGQIRSAYSTADITDPNRVRFSVLYTYPPGRNDLPVKTPLPLTEDTLMLAMRSGESFSAEQISLPPLFSHTLAEGYRLISPIFKNETAASSAEGNEKLQGLVSVAFPASTLLRKAIAGSALPAEIHFEIHDMTVPEKEVLLFRFPETNSLARGKGRIERTSNIRLWGRLWTFDFLAPEGFGLNPPEKSRPWLVLAAGFFITAVITGLVNILITAFLRNIQVTQGISAELDQSREQLQLALKSAGIAIWNWDILRDAVTVDENTRNLYGKSFEKPLSMDSVLTSVLEEDRARVRREMMDALHSRLDYKSTYRVLREDGSIRFQAAQGRVYRDASGKPVRMLGAAWDITDLKRAEEANQRSVTNYLNMIQNSADGILIVSRSTGNIIFANLAATALFEKPASDLLETPFGFPIAGDQASLINLLTSSGKRRIVELRASRTEWERKPAFTVVLRDVTEKKELEAQFVQAQKMEAVGHLTGGIAHDFNNLLTVINGYSEVLLTKTKTGDPFRPVLEEILKAGRRAAALTSQLLVFSRRQIIQPRIIDLNLLISDLDKMLRRLITETVDLQVKLDPNLSPVKADPSQIEQVVVNISINARDAMPKGGLLTIETSNVEIRPDAKDDYIGFNPGNYARLRIADTGCGMSPEILSHIFEPFFTTKENGKGTGLGLATVYGIVKQAGGNITVKSEAGKGTTFDVYLPAVPGEAVKHRETSQSGLGIVSGHERILVVEDDPQVRSLVTDILISCGYQVLTAANGEEGAELFERESGKGIALVVTDAVMPKLSGPDMVRKIRALDPSVNVLFMSGYSDQLMPAEKSGKSASEFIQKPFSGIELSRKIRTILDNAPPQGDSEP